MVELKTRRDVLVETRNDFIDRRTRCEIDLVLHPKYIEGYKEELKNLDDSKEKSEEIKKKIENSEAKIDQNIEDIARYTIILDTIDELLEKEEHAGE